MNKKERMEAVFNMEQPDVIPVFPRVQNQLRRRLLQLVVDNTVELPGTVSALRGQLPDRIAFNNPEPEPLLCFKAFGFVAPLAGASTRRAVPALLPLRVMTVFPDWF